LTSIDERIRAAFDRISRWMEANGAPLLVENLAPGATKDQIAKAESRFGVALPPDLRTLWSLHDGQREEANGFVEAFDLLSVDWAVAQQEAVLQCIEFAREPESADWWKRSGGTDEELESDHWLPFAARDSDSLAVHGVTGRVFSCDHDDSPKLLSPSLVDWIEGYAARVEAGDYAVREGFGDYYLCRRNRELERLAREREEREAEHARYRRETPRVEQLQKALANRDEELCHQVLTDALEQDGRGAFDATVAMVFAANAEPKFVAGALRRVLRSVTLAPDQWVDVAVGGALLGNNAIREVALSHCAGMSAERLKRLESMVTGAAGAERQALDGVLQNVRAKAMRR
jgi:cell wall assembly regulator SMI1